MAQVFRLMGEGTHYIAGRYARHYETGCLLKRSKKDFKPTTDTQPTCAKCRKWYLE